MDYIKSIEIGLNSKRKHTEIARKIFLSHPTSAFEGNEEKQFEILNEISEFFMIPITNVQIVGSSKIGESLHKKKKFDSKTSDLDIAIIDSNLFIYYTEQVFSITRGFKDLTQFPIYSGTSSFQNYSNYVTKGIFRPDLMPTGSLRADWNSFFGKLSSKHSDLFKSINAGIYLSQIFFEIKQCSTIATYIKIKNGGL